MPPGWHPGFGDAGGHPRWPFVPGLDGPAPACPDAIFTVAEPRSRPRDSVAGWGTLSGSAVEDLAPRISILLPYGDGSARLAITLEALLSQRETDWEALLIDTGTRDDSAQVAAQYAALDHRFRLLRGARCGDGGAPFACARNIGLAKARGEIMTFCEPGALWMPDKLDRITAAFTDVTLDACYAPGGEVEAGDTPAPQPSGDLTVARLMADNPVQRLSNLALRSELVNAVGTFDTRLPHGDDLEWLVRLVGEGYRLAPLDRQLVLSPQGCAAPGASGETPPSLAAICSGRLAALVTAARYTRAPTARDEAARLRRLARRALRAGAPRRQALGFALRGLWASPQAGSPTAAAGFWF